MKTGIRSFIFIIPLLLTLHHPLFAVRIKDLAGIRGMRDNQLIAFSIVIGLNGTGDSAESMLARKPLKNALERMGIFITLAEVRGRSLAAVMVTATLPPFAKQGQKLDVTVSALGDAVSLRGGILVMTPMRAVNREVFAVAQGPLTGIPLGVESPDGRSIAGGERFEFDATVATMCASALLLYAMGLPAFAWVKVGVNGFYAIKRPGIPVIIASISMVLNIILNFLLVGPLGYKGLALSTSIAFAVNFLLLYILLSKRFGLLMDKDAAASLAKTLLAALIMGAGVWGIAHYTAHLAPGLPGQLLHIGLSVCGGALFYALAAHVLGIPEWQRLLQGLRRSGK